MRVAAVAFVLIVGAAVVLWFGNTLNSWVLGGLIGGLAAILLSIPITLTLFTYLARRHDEQQEVEAQEEAYQAQMRSYRARRPVEVYEPEEFELPAGDQWEWQEGNSRYQASTARNLPVPSSQRLPAVRQIQPLTTTNQRATDYTLARQRASESEQRPARERSEEANRPVTQRANGRRPGYYPGFYGHQPISTRGMHQTAALKAARQEAMQQTTGAYLFSPSPRQESGSRSAESGSLPALPQSQRQPARPPVQNARQYQSGRIVDGSSRPSRSGRLQPAQNDQEFYPDTGRLPQSGAQRTNSPADPQTDKIANRYPTTDPLRTQPRTGQFIRQPRIDQQPRNPDIITGSVKTPMVRRAPYLYDDDPLREELAQQIEPPSVRRSSLLYEHYEDDED